MASCFSLQPAAVRCLASSVQSHACPLVGRVSSQQPHNFFFHASVHILAFDFDIQELSPHQTTLKAFLFSEFCH